MPAYDGLTLTDNRVKHVRRRLAAAAVTGLSLFVAILANAPVTLGAVSPTTYRPSHLVRFEAGTYTGYKFSASGGITASKTGSLTRASAASTSLRSAITGRAGAWLLIVNGIWAGYWLRESNQTYLPFTRLRLVSFGAGTHTGYRFNAAGAVIAHKTGTLLRASSAHGSAQALIGSTTSYLLIVDGIWAGYWVPIGTGVGLGFPPLGSGRLTLSTVVTGLDQPLFVTNARDGSGRLFVARPPGELHPWGLLHRSDLDHVPGRERGGPRVAGPVRSEHKLLW